MRGARLYKRGSIWWTRISQNGQRFCESTHTENRSDAQEILWTRVARLKGGEYVPRKARHLLTISDLMDDLLRHYQLKGLSAFGAASQSRWNLHLSKTFSFVPADGLTTNLQRDYREMRKAEGALDATVNREIQILCAAYKLALQADPPRVNRVPQFLWMPENNARCVFIDRESEARIKREAALRGLWQRTFVEMAFAYGWRRGEIACLTPEHVNMADGTIRLGTTKNGEPREVPVTHTLRPLLEALLVGAEGPLFPGKKKIYDEWAAICCAAGVNSGKSGGFVIHDIRRSSARNKRAAGVPTSTIMDIHGWRTEAMFRRYAITDREDIRRALELSGDG